MYNCFFHFEKFHVFSFFTKKFMRYLYIFSLFDYSHHFILHDFFYYGYYYIEINSYSFKKIGYAVAPTILLGNPKFSPLDVGRERDERCAPICPDIWLICIPDPVK